MQIMEIRIWFSSCCGKTKASKSKIQPGDAANLSCIVDSNDAIVMGKVCTCFCLVSRAGGSGIICNVSTCML